LFYNILNNKIYKQPQQKKKVQPVSKSLSFNSPKHELNFDQTLRHLLHLGLFTTMCVCASLPKSLVPTAHSVKTICGQTHGPVETVALGFD